MSATSALRDVRGTVPACHQDALESIPDCRGTTRQLPPALHGWPKCSGKSQGILRKNLKRKSWGFVLPTFQPTFGLLIPDERVVPENKPRREGGTADVSSGPKLSSGQKSRGIYGEERQSERRIVSRERHQNVVDAVSNKCGC